MGQKVNPVGFRLGVNRGWDSVWYAKKKDFGNYLIEDFKIREYIKKNVINSGVSKVMIERTSKKCFVTIYTSRPGFARKGSSNRSSGRLPTGVGINWFRSCYAISGRGQYSASCRSTFRPNERSSLTRTLKDSGMPDSKSSSPRTMAS